MVKIYMMTRCSTWQGNSLTSAPALGLGCTRCELGSGHCLCLPAKAPRCRRQLCRSSDGPQGHSSNAWRARLAAPTMRCTHYSILMACVCAPFTAATTKLGLCWTSTMQACWMIVK